MPCSQSRHSMLTGEAARVPGWAPLGTGACFCRGVSSERSFQEGGSSHGMWLTHSVPLSAFSRPFPSRPLTIPLHQPPLPCFVLGSFLS